MTDTSNEALDALVERMRRNEERLHDMIEKLVDAGAKCVAERDAQTARADAAEASEQALLSSYDAERKALVENAALRTRIAELERDVQAAEAAALELACAVIMKMDTRKSTDQIYNLAVMRAHDKIQALKSPKAIAALEAVRADARRAGMVDGLREAAKMYEDGGGPGIGGWDYFGDFRDAILARADQIERGEG